MNITVNVYHHSKDDDIKEIKELLSIITHKLNKIMQTLQDLQNAVTAEDSVIDSAITLIKGLADQIAGLSLDQAAIDALATDVRAKADALSAAVVANTPTTTSTTTEAPTE